MPMVKPKSQRVRLLMTHLLLWGFLALILFPLLMVFAISLRPNFATGSLIPDQVSWDHWKLALGIAISHADGSVTPPPFP